MIVPNAKKAASMIVHKRDGKGNLSEAPMKPEHAVDQRDEHFHAIAEDLLSALHNKSAADAHSALKAYITAHQMQNDSDPE